MRCTNLKPLLLLLGLIGSVLCVHDLDVGKSLLVEAELLVGLRASLESRNQRGRAAILQSKSTELDSLFVSIRVE